LSLQSTDNNHTTAEAATTAPSALAVLWTVGCGATRAAFLGRQERDLILYYRCFYFYLFIHFATGSPSSLCWSPWNSATWSLSGCAL